MSKHDELLEEAKKAADALHGDTSVLLLETRRSLTDLRDHIEMLIDAVENSSTGDDE